MPLLDLDLAPVRANDPVVELKPGQKRHRVLGVEFDGDSDLDFGIGGYVARFDYGVFGDLVGGVFEGDSAEIALKKGVVLICLNLLLQNWGDTVMICM